MGRITLRLFLCTLAYVVVSVRHPSHIQEQKGSTFYISYQLSEVNTSTREHANNKKAYMYTYVYLLVHVLYELVVVKGQLVSTGLTQTRIL